MFDTMSVFLQLEPQLVLSHCYKGMGFPSCLGKMKIKWQTDEL